MRKLMLATTALLGCGMIAAASPAHALDKVSVGGEYIVRVGMFDYDNISGLTDSNTRDVRNDVEVIFGVEGTLDNGIVYGGKTELQNSGSNIAVDEASMYFKGSFGYVELGDNDGAIDKMHVYAPHVGIEMDVDNGPSIFLNGQISPLAQALEFADNTKVTYMTPAYSGFQLGVSWTPEVGNEGTMVSYDETQSVLDDFFEVAVRYDAEYESFKMRFMGGYTTGDYESTTVLEDISTWMIGMDVTYGSFTFGGAYVDYSDSGLAAGAEDQKEWQLGLTYQNGPFGVGFNYVDTERYFDIGFADQTLYTVMADYKVAEGLSVSAQASMFDQDYSTPGLENDGYIVVLQTALMF